MCCDMSKALFEIQFLIPDSIKSIKDNIKFKLEVKKFLQSQNVSEDQNIYMYF